MNIIIQNLEDLITDFEDTIVSDYGVIYFDYNTIYKKLVQIVEDNYNNESKVDTAVLIPYKEDTDGNPMDGDCIFILDSYTNSNDDITISYSFNATIS